MYHRLIEDYLTHYLPELKAELIESQELQAYIESQEQSMITTRQRILEQLQKNEPGLSQLQREMEADRAVLEMFLPPI